MLNSRSSGQLEGVKGTVYLIRGVKGTVYLIREAAVGRAVNEGVKGTVYLIREAAVGRAVNGELSKLSP